MKLQPTLLFPLLLCSLVVPAQRVAVPDTGKYRIELPAYWKAGNRIWRVLDDKLPAMSEHLRDKELCGDDCKPAHRVIFQMSEPMILDYGYNRRISTFTSEIFDFTTSYRFNCSLLLLNDRDQIITRFVLVDTNEVWKVVNRVELPSYRATPGSRNTLVPNSGLDFIRSTIGLPGITPYAFIQSNKEKLAPGIKDMYGVIDQKIINW
jgi:hypothetical protein